MDCPSHPKGGTLSYFIKFARHAAAKKLESTPDAIMGEVLARIGAIFE
jgi:hypothetical protein